MEPDGEKGQEQGRKGGREEAMVEGQQEAPRGSHQALGHVGRMHSHLEVVKSHRMGFPSVSGLPFTRRPV